MSFILYGDPSAQLRALFGGFNGFNRVQQKVNANIEIALSLMLGAPKFIGSSSYLIKLPFYGYTELFRHNHIMPYASHLSRPGMPFHLASMLPVVQLHNG